MVASPYRIFRKRCPHLFYNQLFKSQEPTIKLINIFKDPLANSVATARTCYSNKPIEVDSVLSNPEQMYSIAQSTYDAGHHTTLQHTYVQFLLSGVSRHFVWAVLHDHSNYNSEERSQRYVKMRPDSAIEPIFETEKAQAAYKSKTQELFQVYEKLTLLLAPIVAEEYYGIFPSREKKDSAKYTDTYSPDVLKKAQEVARYVLPIGTHSNLYHTIPLVTLLRLNRMCFQNEVPEEAYAIIQEMVAQVLAVDPSLAKILQEPLAMGETFEWKHADFNSAICITKPKDFYTKFDSNFSGDYKYSKLVSYDPNAQTVLADCFNELFGYSYDEKDAIKSLMSPAYDRLMGEKMNVMMHSKLGQCLKNVSYTFKKKLSHTGDSQNKRHRMVSGVRMPMYFPAEPDYMIPDLIKKSPEALELYCNTLNSLWADMHRHFVGIESPTLFMYLMPNAVQVRLTESGNLMDLWHKYKMRLCYNAQEEIWRSAVEEVQQIKKVHPYIGHMLLPPCTIRKMGGVKPFCPEGKRFCGVPVWNYGVDSFQRVI